MLLLPHAWSSVTRTRTHACAHAHTHTYLYARPLSGTCAYRARAQSLSHSTAQLSTHREWAHLSIPSALLLHATLRHRAVPDRAGAVGLMWHGAVATRCRLRVRVSVCVICRNERMHTHTYTHRIASRHVAVRGSSCNNTNRHAHATRHRHAPAFTLPSGTEP
jgi:hypothetical protein